MFKIKPLSLSFSLIFKPINSEYDQGVDELLKHSWEYYYKTNVNVYKEGLIERLEDQKKRRVVVIHLFALVVVDVVADVVMTVATADVVVAAAECHAVT